MELHHAQFCPHCDIEEEDHLSVHGFDTEVVTCTSCGKEYEVKPYYTFNGYEINKVCEGCGENEEDCWCETTEEEEDMADKIYVGWAFTKDELDKRDSNRRIYDKLNEKYRIHRNDLQFNPEVNQDDYDVIIGRKACYKHAEYNIIKNKPNLSTDELLLLCDNGNLCFGGRKDGQHILTVWED